MALFIVYFTVALMINTPASYPVWVSWFQHPLINVATALFFVMLLLHAWIGVRDVILDYVKPFAVRAGLLVLVVLVLSGLGFWALGVLFSLISV
jgi:succinate dehydrogenase / fumarate reductase membrane anchor subunit